VILAVLWMIFAPVSLIAAPFSMSWELRAIGLGRKLPGVSALLAGVVTPVLYVFGFFGFLTTMSGP
jgi:hypothetical protein